MLTKKEIKNLIESDLLFLDFAVEAVYNRLAILEEDPIEKAREFCQPIFNERGKIPAIRSLREEAKKEEWISYICEDVREDAMYDPKTGPYLGLVAAKLFVEKYCQ